LPLYKLPNIAAFIAFRVLFNARFYYPVFALLFLDFGLSLSEFSVSNLIWAVTIVSLEVPSGALADVIGRKRLVVLAALLMILEMGVLLVAQPNTGNALLLYFCLNRFLSGAGEAMASGADEALAYDSLEEAGLDSRWSEVLEWQTRLSSVAFFAVMLVGAAVYDPAVLNRIADRLGWDVTLTKADTLKLPIWLTFGNAILALLAALSLKPTAGESQSDGSDPWQKVAQVGRRLWTRHEMMVVVLAAVLFDQAARVSMTMGSQTFWAYGIGEVWFGVIGAAMALVGAFLAGPARRLADDGSQAQVFWLLVILSLTGLLGQAAFGSAVGLLFVVCLSAVMSLNGFFASYYLNQLADSKERATLLSFKGLCCNLGFGVVSLYYSGVSAVWPTESAREYLDSLYSLVFYFAICLIGFLSYRMLSIRRNR
jgi:MFS family permease